MSIPIVESIGAFLENAVNEITVANDFNYTLSATRAKRFLLEDTTMEDLKVYILQGKSETKGDVISPTAPRIVKQEYLIWAVCLQGDKATESIDTKLNKVRSDIEKKLCADHTCGGYAKSLDIISTEPTDQPEVGMLLVIEVLYSVIWNDPYTEA